jgi:hypothetical protein
MGRNLNFKLLILFLALVVNSSLVLADVDCGPKFKYFEPSCNDECTLPDTCEPAIEPPETFCCGNSASVPELPSWFGPFFLATAVAGWEYMRIHRRKSAASRVASKS